MPTCTKSRAAGGSSSVRRMPQPPDTDGTTTRSAATSSGYRDIEVWPDIAYLAHQQHEHERRDELEQELHLCREAEVLLLLELFPVVQKTYKPKHPREQQHEYVYEVALEHSLKADGQAHERDRQNEHHAAHRGGAALALMPFDLSFDLLPGLLGAQPRNIILPERRRKQERRMAILWLRFLTEMNSETDTVPEDFLQNPYLKQAVKLLETSSYNETQLYTYEKFWDAVASERAMVNDALKEGKKQGAKENAIAIARNLCQLGLSVADIAKATNLTIEEVEKILV